MIEVISLKKNYGNKAAVKDISFKVKHGEFFGLLGPNGAGKSTTIKILTGQLLPSYGQAKILGLDVLNDKEKILPNIGIVPEKSNLYERLTIGQNLEFFCRLYNCDIKNVDYYLEQVRLLKEKKTHVKKLSKGMKQRVLLIRALLHKPDILFLDEPTSGLDPSSAADIHNLLKKLNNEGMTILLTSHNMEEVDKLCHRVAFMDSGTIAEMGQPETLKLKYTNNKMRVMVQTDNFIEEKILDMRGSENSKILGGWISEGRVKSIHSCEPTLADIFMKVTGREFV